MEKEMKKRSPKVEDDRIDAKENQAINAIRQQLNRLSTSRKAHMTHKGVTAKLPTKRDEMTPGDNFLETAIAADSVGKSEVELRAQRADTFAALVTALAVDVAKELTVLSAMDIETIDPALHIETMAAMLEADELVTCLLLAIDEIKRQVAKPQRAGFRLAKHPRATKLRPGRNGKTAPARKRFSGKWRLLREAD
jgi:hypothetical protein